ncbi:hypothetical protein AAV96_02595 [Acinetobacter sp. AG1]|uniref:hypothetical protein n=1 Tax=Acinetobacter TaxID=469 RepID=UPI000629B8ED|nr:hypothetical protein [Acinetobacter sp. AG1]KKW81769.1 hypothetical protein AAV96_02595 [Acinetobacter sp. AG1]
MASKDINKFSYLWNGSEPSWCLKRLPTLIEILIEFDEVGFTSKDALKLKNNVSTFSNLSITDLYSHYKGVREINLGKFDERKAVELNERLQLVGFNIKLLIVNDRFIIFNRAENMALTIEDNDIYKLVKEKMIHEGVLVEDQG